MTDDPFAPAAAAGIHRLAIPTPFAVGRVNVYLIEDEPLTLVDAGPNSGTSFDELQRGITGLGHSLEDIELVIVTHQHIDHLGLVSLVVSHSGAEVAALDAAIPFMENFSDEAQADDDFATDIMLRNGIAEDVVAALQSVSRAFRAWGAPVHVTRPLADGEAFELRDRTLHVHYRPGHSPTDTIFHDRERRILIAADHLLAHISSNPLITRPRDGSTGRPQARNARETDWSAATTSSEIPLRSMMSRAKSSSAWASSEKFSMYGTATSMAATSAPECDATSDTRPRWSMCWWVTITRPMSSSP